MNKKIKVLIVDDSKMMCSMINDILVKNETIEVVGFAENGIEALKKIKEDNPDIVTLDISMPVMDGIELLKKLREENIFLRVLVISAFTQAGNNLTLKALDLGAIDVVGKPGTGNLEDVEKEIISKVLSISGEKIENYHPYLVKESDMKFLKEDKNLPKTTMPALKIEELLSFEIPPVNMKAIDAALIFSKRQKFSRPKAILIGVSTGGPRALRIMLPKIPKHFSLPILISQHIPDDFTDSLIKSLQDVCHLNIKKAEDNEEIEACNIYFSPGGKHMGIYKNSRSEIRIKLQDNDGSYQHVPSVDYLFSSAAEELKHECVAIVMTGMGSDGTDGAKKLKKHNVLIVTQDKETSTVYGMPRSIYENKLSTVELSLYDMAHFLTEYINWIG